MTARPTKADVARQAGVSTATVSYVLNNVPGRSISEQTRAAVRRAADELGYRPNLAARNLARRRSGVVLFVLPQVALNALAIEVSTRMTTELARRGVMQVLLFDTGDEAAVVNAITDLDPVAVTGVYPLQGAALAAVEAARIPNFHLGSSRLADLGNLHLTAGEVRIAHLVERGHRRLAYAFSPDESVRPIGEYWLAGLRTAMTARGLPEPELAEVRTANAARIVTEWRERGITAVCAQNDDTAFVVQHGMRQAGLECPRDLAVIGVDAIPLGEVAAPPLTSVAFAADAIVDIATAVFMTALGYPTEAKATGADLVVLLVREST
ncbi:LacI family DNA-binding transcriptional regulator [Nocardia sp. NPDC057227]|uniref:LacI family DNA-binding transcriptional regulator n=1 Tax=Nocardia sp. NPDC057227 TaxID=3346056 RepID=UPI00363C690D